MGIKLGFQLLCLGQSQKFCHFLVVLHLLFQAGNGLIVGFRDHLKFIVTVNSSCPFQISLSGKFHSI